MGKFIVLDEKLLIIKRFQFFLMCCGIYIENLRNYTTLIWIVSLTSAFGGCLMCYSMYLYFYNMDIVATLAHHTMLVIDIEVALVIYYRERTKVLRMIEDLRKSHDYQSQIMSNITVTVQEKRIKNMNVIFKLLISSAIYMLLNLFASSYIEKRLTNTEYMLLYPCWFPLNLDHIQNNIYVYFFELVIVIFITLTVFGVMALLYLTHSHLKSEFELLALALEKTSDRASEYVESNYSSDSNKMDLKYAYIRSIKHCGEHHVEITKYFQDARDVFSYICLAVFITGLIVCVSAGFALISDNWAIKIKFIGITLIQMLYLYTICWFGEEIGAMVIIAIFILFFRNQDADNYARSEKIRLVIYGIPWYDMPKECKSTLCLMVERSLQPLSIISASGHKANLDTYMSIVKASYSYFNMMVASNG